MSHETVVWGLSVCAKQWRTDMSSRYSVSNTPIESRYSGDVLTLGEKWPSFNTRRACSCKTSTRATHSSQKRATSGVTGLSLLVVRDFESPEAPEAPAPSGESRSARGTHTALNWAWESDLVPVICASWRQSHAQDRTYHHSSQVRQPHVCACLDALMRH